MAHECRTLVDREGLRLVGRPDQSPGTGAGVTGAAATASWRGSPLLARYAWRWWGDVDVVAAERHEPLPDGSSPAAQDAGSDASDRPVIELRRRIVAHGRGWSDRLEFVNAGGTRLALTIELEAVAADPVAGEVVTAGGLQLVTRATTVRLTFDPLAAPRPDGADWELSLAPGETVVLRTDLHLGGD